MPKYAAFLRGINVSNRRASGEALRSACSGLGLEEVATFRASGNLVFATARSEPEGKLAKRVEEGLEAALGYAVPVFLRSAAEVRAVAGHEPFDAKLLAGSEGKLQVVFLTRKPTAAKARKALALGNDRDRLALRGRELYWLPSGGLMDSELDRKALDGLLGSSTTRTKGTVELIASKYFAG
jgi:uncharacterized protein (DUF1697 family)